MPEDTTRLHVWITGYDGSDEKKIKQLMKENDFPIQYSHNPSDNGVEFQSHGFEYNDENLALIQDLKQKIQIEFPSRTVELENGTLGDHVAIDHFECIRINDEGEDRSTKSDSSPEWRAFDSGSSPQRECPECGGETKRIKKSDETVCTECGFLLETSDSSTRELDLETTELESDDERSDNGESPPETVDEWEMWYPCPTCESTKLNQIIESHLYVSATEDGSYGGEQGGVNEYNYVECGDCGEVLLDEIGKN